MKKVLKEKQGNDSSGILKINKAIQIVETPPLRTTAKCKHESAALFQPGKPIQIKLAMEEDSKGAFLFYKIIND